MTKRKVQSHSKKGFSMPLKGKKGGMAIAAGATLGGIAGVTLGGVAGAIFASHSAREKAVEAIDTATHYATSAMEAVQETQSRTPRRSQARTKRAM